MLKLKSCRVSIGIRHLYGDVELKGQHYVPAVLPRQETPMQCRLLRRLVEEKKKSFASAGIRTQHRPARRLVVIPVPK
jgi:hypothetical protein